MLQVNLNALTDYTVIEADCNRFIMHYKTWVTDTVTQWTFYFCILLEFIYNYLFCRPFIILFHVIHPPAVWLCPPLDCVQMSCPLVDSSLF